MRTKKTSRKRIEDRGATVPSKPRPKKPTPSKGATKPSRK